MDGKGWNIIEGEDFERGALQCGGLACVEEVIAPIKYALSRNPLGFPETGVAEIRFAQTKLRINGPDIVMSHSVWFKVHADIKTVELLWVEITQPDRIGWEGDEIPF